jgi:imidazolonepropionase-like amidohydrolase
MLLALLACVPGAVTRDTVQDSADSDAGSSFVSPLGPAGLGGCVTPARFALAGGTVVGVGPADVEVADGKIVAVGAVSGDAFRVDVTGRWIVPAAIDSHVHLAYLPMVEEMADGGIAGAVDLAAPTSFLASDHGPVQVVAAGPMVTAVSGYPTQGWGRDGYGWEVATPAEAEAAVDALYAAGARVVKIPFDSGPSLADDTLAAAIGRAHALGMPVAAHALGDDDAARAAAAGADVLAHTPVEALSEGTITAWSGRAVVGTLGAFGGASTTRANLVALATAGATVLYGTDFGNTRTPGIDGREIGLMVEAGLSSDAILAAATSSPATYWHLDDLGAVAPGKAASLLVLARDPLVDPTVLAEPERVWIAGVER